MRALVLRGSFQPKRTSEDCQSTPASEIWRYPSLSVEEVREPSIISPYDMIVESWICGICGSDLHCSEAAADGFVTFGGPAQLPVVLGHELIGSVVALGPEVTKFQKGDLITSESIRACWNCSECADGHLNECLALNLIGLTVDGAFARYVSLDARHCFSINPLLEHLDFKTSCEISAILEPLGVAYKGMVLKAEVKKGDSVAIVGLGPIGLMCALTGFYSGASMVIGFDYIEERVDLARRLGVKAFNSKQLEIEQTSPSVVVRDLTNGRGASLSVEAAGTASAFETALSTVALRGRLLVLGRMPSAISLDVNHVMSRSIEILPSRGHAGYGILPRLIELLAKGSINIHNLITNRFDFDGILDAFSRARSGLDGKILVNIKE